MLFGIADCLPGTLSISPMNSLKMDAKSFVRDGIFVFPWNSSSPSDASPLIGRPSGKPSIHVQRVGGVARAFCLDRFIGMLGWSSMCTLFLAMSLSMILLPVGHCNQGFNVMRLSSRPGFNGAHDRLLCRQLLLARLVLGRYKLLHRF